MNYAFKRACERIGLTGSTPVIELVAIRLLELARAGENDADQLVAILAREFEAT
jgi:hypothetical protein